MTVRNEIIENLKAGAKVKHIEIKMPIFSQKAVGLAIDELRPEDIVAVTIDYVSRKTTQKIYPGVYVNTAANIMFHRMDRVMKNGKAITTVKIENLIQFDETKAEDLGLLQTSSHQNRLTGTGS